MGRGKNKDFKWVAEKIGLSYYDIWSTASSFHRDAWDEVKHMRNADRPGCADAYRTLLLKKVLADYTERYG